MRAPSALAGGSTTLSVTDAYGKGALAGDVPNLGSIPQNSESFFEFIIDLRLEPYRTTPPNGPVLGFVNGAGFASGISTSRAWLRGRGSLADADIFLGSMI